MASVERTRRDKNGLCYLWLTFSLLLVSVVCFGISSVQQPAVYAGIVFLILCSISGLCYLATMCARNSSHNSSCCEIYCSCCAICCSCCYSGGCCYNRLTGCFRRILCLPPKPQSNTQRRLSLTRRDRHRLSARARGGGSFVVVTSGGERIILQESRPGNTTVSASKLRAAEQELQALYQEYSFLQTDATTATSIVREYSRMEYENSRLVKWIEGQGRPTEAEYRDMTQALKKVRRNFRLARARLSQDTSVRASTAVDIDTADRPLSTVNHQVLMYAADMCVPPPYQEHDPLDVSNSTAMTSLNSNTIGITSLNSNSNDMTSQNSNSTGMTSLNSSHTVSNSSSNVDDFYATNTRTTNSGRSTCLTTGNRLNYGHMTCSNSQLTGSLQSLAPPTDETGAPPTYEEATSSTV